MPVWVKVLWRAMRPSFLVLTPACVALGASTALAVPDAEPGLLNAFLVLLGALAAHAGVNLLNEYYDFKSGLDQLTRRTPFNGGSGALVEHPAMALPVLGLGLGMLVFTVTVGAWFMFQSGIAILMIGLMGLALIVTYTQWLNRLPVVCLIAPGLGFGIFMVVGTHIALVKHSSVLVLAVSLIPFFLVNNLLLVNQIPDVEADRKAGRHHYVIAYGVEKAAKVYVVFMAAAYGLVLVYVASGLLPWLGLLALLGLPLSVYAAYGIRQYRGHLVEHLPVLAANVAASVLVPVLLAVAIFIGS